MTSNASNSAPIFATRQQVTAALERAAKRAQIIAEQTGTKLIVVTPPISSRAEDSNEKTVPSANNEN